MVAPNVALVRKWLEEFQQPLGALVITFSYLQQELRTTCNMLARTDQDAFIILFESVRSETQRIHLFSQLAHRRFRDEPSRRTIMKLVEQLKDATNRRNDFIHAEWKGIIGPSIAVKYQMTTRDFKYRPLHYDLKQTDRADDFLIPKVKTVNDSCVRILRVAFALRRFQRKIGKQNDRERIICGA